MYRGIEKKFNKNQGKKGREKLKNVQGVQTSICNAFQYLIQLFIH